MAKSKNKKEYDIKVKVFKSGNNANPVLQKNDNKKEEKKVFIKKNKKCNVLKKMGNKKIFAEKTVEQKKKIMWAVVALSMLIIIPVCVMFFSYNIFLAKQKTFDSDKEWEGVKNKFSVSMEEFQKTLADIKESVKEEPVEEVTREELEEYEKEAKKQALDGVKEMPKIEKEKKSAEIDDSESTQLNDIDKADIEKLKERLMGRDN